MDWLSSVKLDALEGTQPELLPPLETGIRRRMSKFPRRWKKINAGKCIKIKNLLLKVLVLHKFFGHGKFSSNCWETECRKIHAV